MLPQTLTLQKIQTSQTTLQTTGPTTTCRNLREQTAAQLKAVGRQTLLASMPDKIIAIDNRDTNSYIFALTPDSTLLVAATLDTNHHLTRLSQPLAKIPAQPVDYASAGNFLILTMPDTTLIYILYNPDTKTYTYLGTPPTRQTIKITPTTQTLHTADIKPTKFRTPHTDPRTPLSTENNTLITTELKKAYTTAQQSATAAQAWTTPIAIRTALRLTDNTLIALTEPQIIAPWQYQETQRYTIPLDIDANGNITGTQPATLTLKACQLNIQLNTGNLGPWKKIIKQIEILSTPEQPVIDTAATTSSITTYQLNNQWHTACHPTLLADTQLQHRLLNTQMKLHPTVTQTDKTTLLTKPLDTTPTILTTTIPQTTLLTKAAKIMAHDQYLHLAMTTATPPQPYLAHHRPLPAGTQTTPNLQLTITLRQPGGTEHTVTSQINIPDTETQTTPTTLTLPNINAITYPDPTATKATLTIADPAGNIYARTYTMTPTPDNTAATTPLTTLQPLTLPLTNQTALPQPEPQPSPQPDNTIITCQRANPLIITSKPTDIGTPITAMAPQQIGGGAYTRQYIYPTTPNSIIALTHTPDSKHQNYRHITPHTIPTPQAIIPTDSGTYAPTTTGTLLLLRDAKAIPIIRSLPKCYNKIHWNAPTNELWLTSTQKPDSTLDPTLIIQITRQYRAYTRTLTPQNIITATAATLLNIEQHQQTTLIYSLTHETDQEPDQLYITEPQPYTPTGLTKINFGLFGNINAHIDVQLTPPGIDTNPETPTHTLDSLHANGQFTTPITARFYLATPTNRCPTTIRYRISGQIDTLTAITIQK